MSYIPLRRTVAGAVIVALLFPSAWAESYVGVLEKSGVDVQSEYQQGQAKAVNSMVVAVPAAAPASSARTTAQQTKIVNDLRVKVNTLSGQIPVKRTQVSKETNAAKKKALQTELSTMQKLLKESTVSYNRELALLLEMRKSTATTTPATTTPTTTVPVTEPPVTTPPSAAQGTPEPGVQLAITGEVEGIVSSEQGIPKITFKGTALAGLKDAIKDRISKQPNAAIQGYFKKYLAAVEEQERSGSVTVYINCKDDSDDKEAINTLLSSDGKEVSLAVAAMGLSKNSGEIWLNVKAADVAALKAIPLGEGIPGVGTYFMGSTRNGHVVLTGIEAPNDLNYFSTIKVKSDDGNQITVNWNSGNIQNATIVEASNAAGFKDIESLEKIWWYKADKNFSQAQIQAIGNTTAMLPAVVSKGMTFVSGTDYSPNHVGGGGFCLGGEYSGYIFFTQNKDTEAQYYGIQSMIAHETGHQTYGHLSAQQQKQWDSLWNESVRNGLLNSSFVCKLAQTGNLYDDSAESLQRWVQENKDDLKYKADSNTLALKNDYTGGEDISTTFDYYTRNTEALWNQARKAAVAAGDDTLIRKLSFMATAVFGQDKNGNSCIGSDAAAKYTLVYERGDTQSMVRKVPLVTYSYDGKTYTAPDFSAAVSSKIYRLAM